MNADVPGYDWPLSPRESGAKATARAEVAAARAVAQALHRIGSEEFAARSRALARRANALAPHVRQTLAAAGAAAPPRYNPLPAPISAELFAEIADQIVVRARQFEEVLGDLYGGRKLLADDTIPADLILGAPSFLRPMVTNSSLTAPRLAFYAADLVRLKSGDFALLRDHVDTAPGLGHALAIRRLTAEMMPEMRAAVSLVSPAPWLERLREDLQLLAKDGPIGVLTDGSGDAADIGLFARALGGLVLRPGDLAVYRDGLRLKTLAGSVVVHVLLRRMPAATIDPLEQGGSPDGGVAGLFSILRRGRATMLNAPGCAILGVCADRIASSFAQRPAIDDRPLPPIYRLFAARLGTGWAVLPGGIVLDRENDQPADGAAGPQNSVPSLRDLWVVDSGDVEPPPIAPPAHAVPLPWAARTRLALPSRIAESLFWLGRQVERLDWSHRLLSVSLPHFADISALPHEAIQRALLIRVLVGARLMPIEWSGSFRPAESLHRAIAQYRPLTTQLDEIERLLAASAERFSPRMLETAEAALEFTRGALLEHGENDRALPTIAQFLAAFSGVIAEDAARNGAFLFLSIGRRLERAIGTADALALLVRGPAAHRELGLSLAIELADATISYESSYGGLIAYDAARQVLIDDADHPRSLAFQLNALSAAFAVVTPGSEVETMARDVTASIPDTSASVETLADGLSRVSTSLRDLSDHLTYTLFAPRPPGHQFDEEETT